MRGGTRAGYTWGKAVIANYDASSRHSQISIWSGCVGNKAVTRLTDAI
jgi:hypothetical protein